MLKYIKVIHDNDSTACVFSHRFPCDVSGFKDGLHSHAAQEQ